MKTKSLFLIPALLAGGWLLPESLQAGDWKQFRGPYSSSVASDAAVEPHLNLSKVAWKTSLPGRGLGSPIVVGDRVLVTASSGPRQERLHVMCLRVSDGGKIWERQFWATGRTMCHEKTSVAAPSPVSDGERVFALFSSNDLFALDLDGNLLWVRGLGRDYPNASNSLGMSSSPVVSSGAVVVMIENDSESFSAGIDARTGKNLWKMDRPKLANWTSPTLFKTPQGRELVALQSGKGLIAVEPASGKIAWSYKEGSSTIPSSTAVDDTLLVPSFGLTALKTSPGGTEAEQLWRSSAMRPGTASPVAMGSRVYTLNDAGVLSCAQLSDGKRLWQLRLKGPFSATPVASGKHLFCVNEKGVLHVVDTTAAEGAIVSELELADVILSTPSIAHRSIFVRSDGALWRIGDKS
ncbi:MAG: pyrrolo-quinoline quinone [Verrucomicrobia bacterium]|nr:pyrrolo-quinoline quinone [Verrucomicrobiota bacterium]